MICLKSTETSYGPLVVVKPIAIQHLYEKSHASLTVQNTSQAVLSLCTFHVSWGQQRQLAMAKLANVS